MRGSISCVHLMVFITTSALLMTINQGFPTTDVLDNESSNNVSSTTRPQAESVIKEALLLAINEAAAEEKVDDGLVEETEEDEVSISPSSSPPVIIHSPPSIRVLPPVEMMVENEIWQYRYPPFDNIFAAVKEHEHDEQAEKAKLDFLPSYVIGVLDPAELVDGLFSSQQRTPTHGDRNSVHSVIDFPGPVSETDDNIRGGKRAFHQQQSPLTPDGGSRSILVPDDRWVWPSSLQP